MSWYRSGLEQVQSPRQRLTEPVEAEVVTSRCVDDGDLQRVLVEVRRLVVEQHSVPAA